MIALKKNIFPGVSAADFGAPFGWCFIGTGGIAHSAAKAILPTGLHTIASVYSRTFANAQKFASKYHATSYQTLEQAVLADGVDAVYIGTSNNTHFALAKQCLRLGKPVLLEKPFTITKHEAEELFALAKEKNVYLVEAMWTWFAPVPNKIQSLVSSGEIGTVQNVKLTYGLPGAKFLRRLRDPHQGGGALLDVGVYPITYAYRLFGKPVRIICTGALTDGVDLSEHVSLQFKNGLTVNANISVERWLGEVIRIVGTEGVIEHPLYHCRGKATLKKQGEKKQKLIGNPGLDNEFNLVAMEIRAGKKTSDFIPPQATLDVMEILDTCRAQLGLVFPFEA